MISLVPGFNGERFDPLNDTYSLGNGYRACDPRLMRFYCLDSWSPFGTGGVNSYAYCEGDPVNRTDPSGHHSQAGWLGIGVSVALGLLLTPVSGGSSLAVALSVASVTTAIASAGLAVAQQFVEASDTGTASALGWAALGIGIVSGLSSTALSRVVPGAKSLVSLLKGTSNRPIAGLMMDPGPFRHEASAAAVAAQRMRPVTVSARVARMRAVYENTAYEAASYTPLRLPPRSYRGFAPNFAAHRRLIQLNPPIPVYSRELRDLAPLPIVFRRELRQLYAALGTSEEAMNYNAGLNNNHIYVPPVPDGEVIAADNPPIHSPPAYTETDLFPLTAYNNGREDVVLDYHYVTRL